MLFKSIGDGLGDWLWLGDFNDWFWFRKAEDWLEDENRTCLTCSGSTLARERRRELEDRDYVKCRSELAR
jgi:hypothetical protein